MFVLLNGPLGIGKSTLAEALGEAITECVTLHGDALNAVNPPRANEAAQLHETVALLVEHHSKQGYRHFVIEHLWLSAEAIADLTDRLPPAADVRRFRLTLPESANRRRIERRQAASAIDERDMEWRCFAEEHAVLSAAGDELGEPFDVSDTPDILVERLLERLGLTR